MPINKLDLDLVEALKQAWTDIETEQGMTDSANDWLQLSNRSASLRLSWFPRP